MEKKNLIIGLVTAGVLTGGAALIIYLALRHHQKVAEQKKLRNRAINAIRSVKPQAFRKADRSALKALSEKSLQKVHTVRIRKAQPHAPADLAVRSVFFNEAVKHLSENAPALKVLKARPRGPLFRIFSSFHNSTHAARALPHSPLPPASSRSTGTA